MQLSTVRKIALGMKIAFGAGFGYLTLGSPAAAIISGVMAYCLVVSLPVPNLPFRESLRVNWRSFCFLGGLLAMGAFYFITKMHEAEVVMRCFSAGFVGVLLGEMLSKPLFFHAEDTASKAEEEAEPKAPESGPTEGDKPEGDKKN